MSEVLLATPNLKFANSVLFAIFGLCIGSFLNVLIYRLPLKIDIIFTRSACINCGKKLKFYHLIPVISWLLLGGKCAFCKAKISPRYPAVELISCVIFVIIFLKFNPQNFLTLALTALFGLCFALLLALSVIDIKYKAVPDSLLFFTLGISLFYSVFTGQNFYDGLFVSLGFGLSFFVLRFVVSHLAKREAMGSADIFIAAIIGALLGFSKGVLGIYIGAILTLPFYLLAGKNYELAFVPFLSAGAFVSFVVGEQILQNIGLFYE